MVAYLFTPSGISCLLPVSHMFNHGLHAFPLPLPAVGRRRQADLFWVGDRGERQRGGEEAAPRRHNATPPFARRIAFRLGRRCFVSGGQFLQVKGGWIMLSSSRTTTVPRPPCLFSAGGGGGPHPTYTFLRILAPIAIQTCTEDSLEGDAFRAWRSPVGACSARHAGVENDLNNILLHDTVNHEHDIRGAGSAVGWLYSYAASVHQPTRKQVPVGGLAAWRGSLPSSHLFVELDLTTPPGGFPYLTGQPRGRALCELFTVATWGRVPSRWCGHHQTGRCGCGNMKVNPILYAFIDAARAMWWED